MKTEIKFTKYNQIEFSLDELKPIEIFITNQLKPDRLNPGITFLYKGVVFIISSIGYDIENNIHLIFMEQLTTKKP